MQMQCRLRERGSERGAEGKGVGVGWWAQLVNGSDTSQYSRRARPQCSSAPATGLVQCIMRCLNRLLDPTLSDSAAIFVGHLVTSVVNNVRCRVPLE